MLAVVFLKLPWSQAAGQRPSMASGQGCALTWQERFYRPPACFSHPELGAHLYVEPQQKPSGVSRVIPALTTQEGAHSRLRPHCPPRRQGLGTHVVVQGAADVGPVDGRHERQVLPVLALQVVEVLVSGGAVPGDRPLVRGSGHLLDEPGEELCSSTGHSGVGTALEHKDEV